MEIDSVDCPKCGGSIPEQVRRGKLFRCNHCGSTLVWPDRQSTLVLSYGLKLCPDCGVDNEQTRSYCRNCGANLTKICYLCKSAFYVGDNFCPNGHNYEYERQNRDHELQKLEIRNRGDLEHYLHDAKYLALEGNLEQAANILEVALSENPAWSVNLVGFPYSSNSDKPASGYALLVHLAGSTRRKKLALHFFTRMLEINPNEPQVALVAAREAGIEKESQEIAKRKGLKWQWWL